jgi:dihydrofolate reductase
MIASVFIATSLDGFIAREDGALDWLELANQQVPEGEDCGFFAFMDSVDALVMGRNTFEMVISFGQWPYGEKRVVVLSRNPLEIPENLTEWVEHSSETPELLFDRLSEEGHKRIYVDGGITIQQFLKAGLINDLRITVLPVILGKGIALFGELDKDVMLKHIDTKTYSFGFTQSVYEVENRPE